LGPLLTMIEWRVVVYDGRPNGVDVCHPIGEINPHVVSARLSDIRSEERLKF
jgi:hypothetical protein